MALVHQAPLSPTSTAPLRLTPKSPLSPITPTSAVSSAYSGDLLLPCVPRSPVSPGSVFPRPMPPPSPDMLQPSICRSPTPPRPKRVQSSPFLQQHARSQSAMDTREVERNSRSVTPEPFKAPIVTTPLSRSQSQNHASRMARLGGRLGLGGVLSTRKGVVVSSAAIVPTSTAAGAGERSNAPLKRLAFKASEPSLISTMVNQTSLSDTKQASSVAVDVSAAPAPKRKWRPFGGSSLWPGFHSRFSPSASPLDDDFLLCSSRDSSTSSDSNSEEEDVPTATFKSETKVTISLPLRGILKNAKGYKPPNSLHPVTAPPAPVRTVSAPILDEAKAKAERPSLPQHSASLPTPAVKPLLHFLPPTPASTPAPLPPRGEARRLLEVPDLEDDENSAEGGRDGSKQWERSLSELFDGVMLLASGANNASVESFSTSQAPVEEPVASFQQTGGKKESALSPEQKQHEGRASNASSILSSVPLRVHTQSSIVSYLMPEETPNGEHILSTKRSSSALPLPTPIALNPTPPLLIITPSSPAPGIISFRNLPTPPSEEMDELASDETAYEQVVQDVPLDIVDSDHEEDEVNEPEVRKQSIDEFADRTLPRYSQLIHPKAYATQASNTVSIPPPVIEEEATFDDLKATIKYPVVDITSGLTDLKLPAPHTPLSPTTARGISLTLPPARQTRRLSRAAVLDEQRSSQQWDVEKVTNDVRQVVQRLRWDKAQKAWQLVRQAEHSPTTPFQRRTALPSSSHYSFPSIDSTVASVQGDFAPHLPLYSPMQLSMLPPGKMEWALVDSATPSVGVETQLIFRLCIAWRVTPSQNHFRHPFGPQEEVKVFVLGRTAEEFYQFHLGLMERFMLEPRRHSLTRWYEMSPRAKGTLEPMDPPIKFEMEVGDLMTTGGRSTIAWDGLRNTIKEKVDSLECWVKSLMALRETDMAMVLESDYVRTWLAPRREGDCERSVESWRKEGHGEIGRDSEGIARILERLR